MSFSMNGMLTKLSGESAFALMSLLGASIMPHSLYLHSSIVQVSMLLRLPVFCLCNYVSHPCVYCWTWAYACMRIFVVYILYMLILLQVVNYWQHLLFLVLYMSACASLVYTVAYCILSSYGRFCFNINPCERFFCWMYHESQQLDVFRYTFNACVYSV